MKTRSLHRIFLAGIFIITSFICRAGIELSREGKTNYSIVIPKEANALQSKAAEVLATHLKDVSDADFPIITDESPVGEYEILLGNNLHLQSSGIKIDTASLENDGFLIMSWGNRLIIEGGKGKGLLYGVYTFLEKYLGCRLYAPGVKKTPHQPDIVLDDIYDKEVPVIKFRELYFPSAADSEYCDWHKLDVHNTSNWGMWVHTFDDLVPPDIYFRPHPEYFSEINGKRVPNGQLCLSNPEVVNLLTARLQKKIQTNPAASYWSVSQNDNYLSCQCEQCKAEVSKLGGESGLILKAVNQVASNFPSKTISTLAYQYSRSAPTGIMPANNVNIMLCTIECNRSRPIAEDPGSSSFVRDIRDWGKLTHNILVWDYVVQFRNYISPFPNLQVLQPNIKFFVNNNCGMMFQQGSGKSVSEFHELRSYLIAKLLWNPDMDFDDAVEDFLEGYYGGAAKYIGKYIDRMQSALKKSGDELHIYGYPYDGIDSYISPSLLKKYSALFDRAGKVVKDDPVLLKRVVTARLPLEFAILDISMRDVDKDLSYFRTHKGHMQVKPGMLKKLDEFTVHCKESGVERLEESGTSPDEYKQQVLDFIDRSMQPDIAKGKQVMLLTDYSQKYPVGGATALTDGKRGIPDYHFNWLGFEGNDMEAILDLGETKEISEISLDFLQNNYSWIFMPREVSFYSSYDGMDFKEIGIDMNDIPTDSSGTIIRTFKIHPEKLYTRFIKVRAESLKTCPDWHIGKGKKCWIFTDELLVR